jgi:hypothetical protein
MLLEDNAPLRKLQLDEARDTLGALCPEGTDADQIEQAAIEIEMLVTAVIDHIMTAIAEDDPLRPARLATTMVLLRRHVEVCLQSYNKWVEGR